MKVLHYLLILLLFLFACQDKKEEKNKQIIENLLGQKIQIPPNAIMTYWGEDTISQLPDKSYTIVNYIDSTDCINCKLQTFEWKEFMNKMERIFPEKILLLFCIQTENTKEIKWLLKGDDFNYPVCFDPHGTIIETNQLPLEDIYHTLLLDSQKRILLVGSPINNASLEKLYISLLTNN